MPKLTHLAETAHRMSGCIVERLRATFLPPPDPQIGITFAHVPYPRYNVIACLARFEFPATSSVQIGGQEFFCVQSSNFTTDGFIRATATSLATAKLAAYAVFEGLISDSFTITVNKRDGNRPAIAGVQIVRVPEPGCFTQLTVSTVFPLLRWRRASLAAGRGRRALCSRRTQQPLQLGL
jgi:hypothetical protein